MAAPESRPVAELSLNELIDEIIARTPTGTIAIHVPDDGQQCSARFWLWGNGDACIGLATRARLAASRSAMGKSVDG